MVTHAAPIDVSRYWPMAAGNRWLYACKSKYDVGMTSVFSSASGQSTAFHQVDGQCVANASYLMVNGSTSIQLTRILEDGSTITFTPASLYLPKSAELGQTFSTSGTALYVSPDGSQTLPFTATVTVVGTEFITVPAGRFNALHVRQSMTFPQVPEASSSQDLWLGDGVGELRRHERKDDQELDLQLVDSNLTANATKDDGDDCDQAKFCGDPINYATGNSFQSEIDLALKGAQQFARFYNSRAPILGALGYGWRHSYERRLVSQLNLSPSRVSLSRPDGKFLHFNENPLKAWTTESDVNFSVTAVYDSGTTEPPTSWVVKTAANELEIYDADGELTSISSMSGFKLDFLPGSRGVKQVLDSHGRGMGFEYRDDGRLTAISWGGGNRQTFDYDDDLNLTAVGFPDATSKAYRYNEPGRSVAGAPAHALTSTLDESTVEDRYWTFDSTGRATSSQRAGGAEKVTIQYGSNTAAITDALGVTRNVAFSIFSGVARPQTVTSKSNQAILGTHASRAYDAAGNVVSRNDFNGYRTCVTNDSTRNLQTVRVEGLPGTAACASYLPAGSTLPAGVRKVSTQWHPRWRVPIAVAQPNKLVYDVYNGQVDPVAGGTTSCAPASAKLPDDQPIAVLCRRYELATTDTNGAQGLAAARDASVAARVNHWTYNEIGQVLTWKDPLGNQTTYAYYSNSTADHTRGDLYTVTNARSQQVRYSRYNVVGQWLEMVDPNGVATTRAFDDRNRLKSVAAASLITSFEYWPTGLLKKVSFPDASEIRYGYDNAHRLTTVTDSRGNKITYTLDAAGNRRVEQMIDPAGVLARSLTRVPNALNRIEKVTGRDE